METKCFLPMMITVMLDLLLIGKIIIEGRDRMGNKSVLQYQFTKYERKYINSAEKNVLFVIIF